MLILPKPTAANGGDFSQVHEAQVAAIPHLRSMGKREAHERSGTASSEARQDRQARACRKLRAA